MVTIELNEGQVTDEWLGWNPSREMSLNLGSFFSQKPTRHVPLSSCTSYHCSAEGMMVAARFLRSPPSTMLICDYIDLG